MPVTQTWNVFCDNPSLKCSSHAVFGKPNESKNAVIARAFHSFGYVQISVEDSVGYIDHYILCGECAKLKRYPTR